MKRDAFVLSEDPHPDYGYSYRAIVHESDFPVQWSSKKTDFVEGMVIVAKTSEVKKAKTSGKEYIWLTGVDKTDSITDSGADEQSSVSPPSQPELKEPKAAADPKSSDNKYQKDVTDVPFRVWSVLINIQGVPENQVAIKTFMKTVKAHSDELLKMISEVRNGKDEEDI